MSGSAPPGQLYPGQYAPPPAIAPFVVDDSATRAGRLRPHEVEVNLLATTLGVMAGAPFRVVDTEQMRRAPTRMREDVSGLDLPLASLQIPPAAMEELVRRQSRAASQEAWSNLLTTTLATPAGVPFKPAEAERAVRAVLERSDIELRSLAVVTAGTVPVANPDFTVRQAYTATRAIDPIGQPLALRSVGAPFTPRDLERQRLIMRREDAAYASSVLLTPAQLAPFVVEDLSTRLGRPASQETWASLLTTTLAAAPAAAPFKSVEADRPVYRVRRTEDFTLNLSSGVLFQVTQVLREAQISLPRPWRIPPPFDAPNLLLTTLAPAVPVDPFKIADVDVARRAHTFLRASEPSGSPLLLLRVGAPLANTDFTVRQSYTTTRAVEPMGMSLAISTTGTVPFFKPDFTVRQPYAATRAVEPMGMPLTFSTIGAPFKLGDHERASFRSRRMIEDFSNLLVQVPIGAAPFKPAVEAERREWRRLRQEEIATEQPLLAALFISGRIRIIEAQSRIRALTAEERARLIELQNRLRVIEAQTRGSVQ